MTMRYRGTREEARALDAFVKLLRCTNSVRSHAERHLRELRLTENQLGVLEALFHLGPLPQHRLGEKLLTSRANITLIADQLADKGLVQRRRDERDRRQMVLSLTARGRRFIERVFPGHARRIAEAFSVLDATEQAGLAALCRKLGLAVDGRKRPRLDA